MRVRGILRSHTTARYPACIMMMQNKALLAPCTRPALARPAAACLRSHQSYAGAGGRHLSDAGDLAGVHTLEIHR